MTYHGELRDWHVRIGLTAVVLAVFGGTLWAPFVYDDHALLVDSSISSSGGWWMVWRPMQTRPLTYFTFWCNHQLGGSEAAGYHAVNLALHLGAALLLFAVLGRLLPKSAAVGAAFLFAVHPLAVEPVAYVFARSTLLATVFSLACLLFWVRGRHWAAVGWFGLALLAKEECAALPVVLGLLHFSISRNRAERAPVAAMLGLAAAAVARVAVVSSMVAGSGAGAQAGVRWQDYFLTQGLVIARYLRMLVAPYGMSVDPDVAVETGWVSWLAWALIAASMVAALRWFDRAGPGFWWISGLLLLLPTSSLFPAADLAADRRMYLPMIAFAALAALLLERIGRREVMVAAVVVLGAVSWWRTQVWRSEIALWSDAMEQAPGKLRPRLQLARVEEPRRAMELLAEAKRMDPDDPRAAMETGRLLLREGRFADALREFGLAVALAPRDANAYSNRGVALWGMGLRREAIRDFQIALRLDPNHPVAKINLEKLTATAAPK